MSAVATSSEMADFFDELNALERELRAGLSEDDLEHLLRIDRWSRRCTAAGWATAWMGPNLLSAGLLSLGRTARWTMLGHHIRHGGYSRLAGKDGAPDWIHRERFAAGGRRVFDWLDVILPEAWDAEHNDRHHTRLGEDADPDRVEDNLAWLRASSLPMPVRYAFVAVMASAWKWIYYAPNTLQELRAAKDRAAGGTGARHRLSDWRTWSPTTQEGRSLWLRAFLPYALIRFALAPGMFAPLGPLAVASAATNSLLAELLTNLHTFVIITTNHVGDDVYAFDDPPDSREDFVLRQIVGSVNYSTGGDVNDFLHGWLNYQIEHHVWPDMSMLQYQRAQPRLKALCEKYGVPYVQQPVGARLRQTLRVMTGRADMKRGAYAPERASSG
ncbi:MAG: fatty acid desaturase [Myxococcota bacterium]